MERSVRVVRMPDELLEYYGDLFTKWKLRNQGIIFERFLAYPDYYIQKLAFSPEATTPPGRFRRWLKTKWRRAKAS